MIGERVSSFGVVSGFGLGIFSLSLFCKDIQTARSWSQILSNSNNLDRIIDTDCILYMKSSFDANGALRDVPRFLFTEVQDRGKVTIIFKNVASWKNVTDLIFQVRSQQNKIHTIFIEAHGNSSGIAFSEKEGTVGSFVAQVNLLNSLPPIVLIACGTANESNTKTCFARSLSSLLDTFVVGSSDEISTLTTSFYEREIVTKKGRERVPFGVYFHTGSGFGGDGTKVFYKGVIQDSAEVYPLPKRLFVPFKSRIYLITTSLVDRLIQIISKIYSKVSKSLSSFTISFAKFRIPSESFSVAIASSFER